MRQHFLASDTDIRIQQHQPLPRPPLKSAAMSRLRLRMVAAAITGKAQLQAAQTAASASRDASAISGSSLAEATGGALPAAGDAAAPAGNSSSQEPRQKQQKKRAPKQLKLFDVTESVVVPAAAAGDYGASLPPRVADTLAALLPERFKTVTAAKREVRRGHILLDGSKAKTDM